MSTAVDRPTSIRAAVRALVAERGFHGASMSAVAQRAGVATGTAYVHYASKDELIVAAYLEAKRRVGEASVAAVDDPQTPEDHFVQMWLGGHDHLVAEPVDARFMLQVDSSPFGRAAHARAVDGGDDPLMTEAARSGLWAAVVDLPIDILYDLGFAPLVRLAAREDELDRDRLTVVARRCWAAIAAATPDS